LNAIPNFFEGQKLNKPFYQKDANETSQKVQNHVKFVTHVLGGFRSFKFCTQSVLILSHLSQFAEFIAQINLEWVQPVNRCIQKTRAENFQIFFEL